MARRTTLKDVAQRAGVSTATVARVLHNNGYVADETRQVVEAVLTESAYQLNVVAQGLRKRRTSALGHLLHSIAPNPFFAGVALGAEQEAARRGCGVLVYNTHGDPDEERRGLETLLRRRVDAILFTTVSDERNVGLAVAAGVPIVQVERVAPVATHAVTVDNYRGAFDATEHLLDLGHHRIALLGVDPEPGPAASGTLRRRVVERERFSGYLDALRGRGVAVRDDLVVLGESYLDLAAAREAVRRWLAGTPETRPTAIFAACDMQAAGVLQELYDLGLRVPDDVSLVGFDDTHAGYLTPPLTTVRQPMAELGRVAVRLVMGALDDPKGMDTPSRERLTTRLVVRASTGPPPVGA